jgi:hypothetical protein
MEVRIQADAAIESLTDVRRPDSLHVGVLLVLLILFAFTF